MALNYNYDPAAALAREKGTHFTRRVVDPTIYSISAEWPGSAAYRSWCARYLAVTGEKQRLRDAEYAHQIKTLFPGVGEYLTRHALDRGEDLAPLVVLARSVGQRILAGEFRHSTAPLLRTPAVRRALERSGLLRLWYGIPGRKTTLYNKVEK